MKVDELFYSMALVGVRGEVEGEGEGACGCIRTGELRKVGRPDGPLDAVHPSGWRSARTQPVTGDEGVSGRVMEEETEE